ncbi:MAG: phosphatase PAP2 family protein [Rubrobacter sp.]|nr:phosphatase PAP2 family protein [Rubrobacter sp.]
MRRSGSTEFRVLGAAFLAFSAAVGAGWLYGFDLWTLRAAQERTYGALDAVSNLLSSFGSPQTTAAALVVLAAGLWLYGRRSLAVRLVLVFVAASLVEVAMKYLLPQAPMPEGISRSSGHSPLVELAYPYPYPSGHMLRAVIVFGAAYLLVENGLLRTGVVLLLAVMALSRVYLGVHWTTDLVGGALLGAAGLAWAFRARNGERKRSRKLWR